MTAKTGVTALGSGSRGNAVLVHRGGEGILIDAGFSGRQLFARLELCGVSPGTVRALLITHEHEDHARGARILAETLGIPTYLTTGTGRYLRERNKIAQKVIVFEPGTKFSVSDFSVEPFDVPHDAVQPVGYVIRAGETKIGVATDIGKFSRLAVERLRGCDALVIESNYDAGMLRNSQRPFFIKRRIHSHIGHMSNNDTMEALGELVTEKTRRIVFAHISSECNSAELVLELARARLTQMGREDILLTAAPQDRPAETVWI
jgi:phosphoribosyl 1,2-cyclic phosphodiesterase